MSVLKVDQIQDTAGGNTVTINGATPTVDNTMGRNRIINGDMRIDQRNAGASSSTGTTASQTYSSLDRWGYIVSQASKFTMEQNAGSVTPPAGFTNYLGCTSTAATSVGSSDYFNVNQVIEGFNVADLGWGTANAKTITISFWVRSSLTGTFGGSLRNSAINRSYPYTYAISSADTWEQKSITIAGETTGTWLTTNGWGLQLVFSLGMGSTFSGTAGTWASTNYASATGATSVVGTNGATWYITGVQLEVGSVATPFERRPYGQELALCQRYYQNITNGYDCVLGLGVCTVSSRIIVPVRFVVPMRSNPSIYSTLGSGDKFRANGATADSNSTADCTIDSVATVSPCLSIEYTNNGYSGLSTGQPYKVRQFTSTGIFGASAEL